MKRLRRYTAILVVFAILALISWAFFESQPDPNAIPTGTANTVAELREQIPFHELLADLPEIGPFHWEGPYSPYDAKADVSDDYTIRGKAKDPMVLLKWINEVEAEERLDPDRVELIGGFLTTGFGIDVYSDGSYRIGQYRFAGDGYLP